MHAFVVLGLVFFDTKPSDWLGETCPKWPVLCRVGRKPTTQSTWYLGNLIRESLACAYIQKEGADACQQFKCSLTGWSENQGFYVWTLLFKMPEPVCVIFFGKFNAVLFWTHLLQDKVAPLFQFCPSCVWQLSVKRWRWWWRPCESQ